MVVNVLNVAVGGVAGEGGVVAPAASPLEFEITLELLRKVKPEMYVEWKMVYVISQGLQEEVLDSVELGPLEVATMKFVLAANPPNLLLFNKEDQFDVAAVYLSGLFNEQEFVRIGYYVKHEYAVGSFPVDPVSGMEYMPEVLQIDKLLRRVDASNPRVTRFAVKWDDAEADPLQAPPVTYGDMDMEEASEDEEGDDDPEEEDEEEDSDAELSIDVSDEEAQAIPSENGPSHLGNGTTADKA